MFNADTCVIINYLELEWHNCFMEANIPLPRRLFKVANRSLQLKDFIFFTFNDEIFKLFHTDFLIQFSIEKMQPSYPFRLT